MGIAGLICMFSSGSLPICLNLIQTIYFKTLHTFLEPDQCILRLQTLQQPCQDSKLNHQRKLVCLPHSCAGIYCMLSCFKVCLHSHELALMSGKSQMPGKCLQVIQTSFCPSIPTHPYNDIIPARPRTIHGRSHGHRWGMRLVAGLRWKKCSYPSLAGHLVANSLMDGYLGCREELMMMV